MKFTLVNYTGIGRKVSKECDANNKETAEKARSNEAGAVNFLLREDSSHVLPGKNGKTKDGKTNVQKRVLNDNLKFLHMKFLSNLGGKIFIYPLL